MHKTINRGSPCAVPPLWTLKALWPAPYYTASGQKPRFGATLHTCVCWATAFPGQDSAGRCPLFSQGKWHDRPTRAGV